MCTRRFLPIEIPAPLRARRRLRYVVATPLIISGALTTAYTTISLYMATQLAYAPHLLIDKTPAALGLEFKEITFPSRIDHLQLRGWLIPGILPNGKLTTQRTIIMVHGTRANRTDPGAGLLNLSGELARQGFAILAFDMRGAGESPRAPLSLGYFEQRDVLGAVDFLQSDALPYPELGHPQSIAGWGISMGAATLLQAAAHEPAIRALVSDSAYADVIPVLQREIPKASHLPPWFTPGALLAARALYGINFSDVRPVDVVAKLAPRPIFFIHGESDDDIPVSHLFLLANAARSTPTAAVQTWLVDGAKHAQAFNSMSNTYVSRVVDFYTTALGPDSGSS